MKMLMKSKCLSLKGSVLVWMLMATVASSSLTAQPPKLDDDSGGSTSTTNSTATSSGSASSASSSSSSSSSGSASSSLSSSISSAATSSASSVPLASAKNEIGVRTFNRGLNFLHIPKTAGSHLWGHILSPHFNNAESLAHQPVRNWARSTRDSIPIVTWLKDPLARTVSQLRYTKMYSKNPLYRTPTPKGQRLEGVLFISEEGARFFQQVFEADFNKVGDLRNLVAKMSGEYDSFLPVGDSGFNWPLLSYTEFFAPPGMDFTSMDDGKVSLCVEYALQYINFFGETERFEESLNEFNLAFHCKIDSSLAKLRLNETAQDVQKIDFSQPEIKDFFDKLLVWEYKIYEKLRAAQRWRIAMPMVQDPEMPGFALTQFILPQGFDPDIYLLVNYELGLTVAAKFGNDLWKKREYALRHYVTHGKAEGRLFDFSGLTKLDNGLFYPKMSFAGQSPWPGLIARVQGLSGVEPWGTWSEGPQVTFEFVAPLPKDFAFKLNAGAFGPNVGQDITATVGSSVRKFKLKDASEEITIPFLNSAASNIFTIDVPQPTAPASLTDGVGDPRLLGLAFVSLEVIPLLYHELDPVLEVLEKTEVAAHSSK